MAMASEKRGRWLRVFGAVGKLQQPRRATATASSKGKEEAYNNHEHRSTWLFYRADSASPDVPSVFLPRGNRPAPDGVALVGYNIL